MITQIDKLVLDTAPMAIVSTDMYGDIMTVNPAVRSIFGYLEGELEGESFLKLVPQLQSMNYSFYDDFTSRGDLELFDDKPGSGETKTTDQSNFLERFYYGICENDNKGEIQTARKDGELLWIKLYANRVTINDTLHYIVIISDITESKRKEQQIIQLNASLERRVQERTQALEKTHSKVSLLLDSSAQGFLAVGDDLLVDPEYSKACDDIFGQSIAGQSIARLLFPEDKTQRDNLHKNIRRVLDEKDAFVQDLYLCLLNDEYRIRNRSVEIEFKFIASGQVVLVVTDVTKRKKLEHKLHQERNRLQFIVATVQDPAAFFELVDEFRLFVEQQFPVLMNTERSDLDKAEEVFRLIHTFKGCFSQLDFLHLPDALHRLEQQLKSLLESGRINSAEIVKLLNDSHCEEVLKTDLAIIEQVLGEGFMHHEDEITLNPLQIRRIEHFIAEQRPGPVVEEVSALLKDLLQTRLVNIKSLLGGFSNSTLKLADSFGKLVYPFDIKGKDLLVDAKRFSAFTRALVHVFRNAVDHGIESPDERVACGKDETGTISVEVKTLMEYMVITISDDGAGLNLERIKAEAIKKGIYSETEVAELAFKPLSRLIFDDRFSTKAKTTCISGRGVGLAAVRSELKKLKGDVKISSEPGAYTRFQFVIPYRAQKV